MFATRILLVVIAVVAVLSLWVAAPGRSAGPETRYVVRPGDTLWSIAASRYAGDPREAVWKIKHRNGRHSSALSPGEVLALP